MSDGTPPETPAPSRKRNDGERAWWVPLLGVGSVGFGGLQVLVGASLLAVSLVGPESTRGIFALLGAAWALPGPVIAAGGVGVVLGKRWGRHLSVAGAVLGILMLVSVALNRSSIPPAIPELVEFAENHPDADPQLKQRLRTTLGGANRENIEMMREERHREIFALTYTGYCCVPVFPWYLVLLIALAPPWGKRILATERDGE